jgi:hypothetical protein
LLIKCIKKNETVSKYLKENGINIRNTKVTQEIIEEVCTLYESGLSEEKVGKQVNLCRKTVRNILKNNNIKIRDNSEYRTYSLNEHYFDKIDTQNKAYILGFFYADGNVSVDKYNIQLGIQARDVEILEKMKEEFGSDCKLFLQERSKNNYKHQDIITLQIHSKYMHNSLAQWGIVPQKTHGIIYPNFLNNDLNRHFLRGVMDGDGCIHGTELSSGRRCRAIDICGTENFCIGAKEIIEKELGIHCSIIVTNQDHPDTKKLVISGIYQSKKFLDWIYEDANMYLTRKYNIYVEKYVNELEKESA